MTKKAKSRGTPKRVPKRKPAPAPAAAVRALEQRLALVTGKRAPRVQVLPPLQEVDRKLAVDEVSLGELGFAEVKLSQHEEEVLSEPVPAAEVLLKPTGQPYLSHPSYTRWFNRAFGRMGWSLVPASSPKIVESSVVCAYVLHIHKQPVALAWGEQEYFAKNREQSYGDALEATVANALRRCAKRLGVGLELWDRAWCAQWLRDNDVIEVWVQGRGEQDKPRKMYRRSTDTPFYNETGQSGGGGGRSSRRSAAEEMQGSTPPAKEEYHGHHSESTEKITDKQAKRLWAITLNSGRSNEEVARWLLERYQFKKSTDVTRDKYDAICKAIEDPRDLPKGRA